MALSLKIQTGLQLVVLSEMTMEGLLLRFHSGWVLVQLRERRLEVLSRVRSWLGTKESGS
ncbi:hypothetical protein LINPERPRIM_LOCUS11515 [Linum perenne]